MDRDNKGRNRNREEKRKKRQRKKKIEERIEINGSRIEVIEVEDPEVEEVKEQ